MAKRKINCGKYWTLLSTECWVSDNCKSCIYERYCTDSENIRDERPIIKTVVDMLLQKFGEPPEKFVLEAKDLKMNPETIQYLKKMQC